MSLMDEFKKIIHPYDDEDDDYEEDVGRDSEPTYFEPREPRESSRRKEVPAEERRNKVVNIHATTQLKVVLVKPERFENASEIADHLREKRTVVLIWRVPTRMWPGGWWISSPVWPTPVTGRSRRSPPIPISSRPIPWISWAT